MMTAEDFTEMPPMLEKENDNMSTLMVMIALLMLVVMGYMWWRVWTMYDTPLSPQTSSPDWKQQIDSFTRNRNYMTALAAAFSVVFLFLVYKIM
jgi:hypothetical protein